MKELADRIAQKIGVSSDQATTAVQMVAGFLKDKLPQPVAGQIDRVLGQGGEAQAGAKGGLGDVASGIGDVMGKRKAG